MVGNAADAWLDIYAISQQLPFDIFKILSVLQGMDGRWMVQARQLNSNAALVASLVYPVRTEAALAGDFSFMWHATGADSPNPVVLTVSDTMLTALELPIVGNRPVGVIPVGPTIQQQPMANV